MKDVQAYAILRRARISPKKVAPVLDLIRGKKIYDAKVALTFDNTKAARTVLKVLKSAEANAKNNAKLKTDGLFVEETWVSGGPVAKTGHATGKSYFSPILKRTSHIYVGLSERNKK
jgi:large subunit ribosomal protein L22